VIAEEIINNDEINHLKQYCQCDLRKYIICPCCIGCLNSEHPQIYVIKKTRKYIENNLIKI
jgi:hypothetical protein